MRKFALRTLPFVVAWALALYMVPWTLNLAQYRDKQTYLYDQAIAMATSDDPAAVAQAPQAFIEAYKYFMAQRDKGITWSERYLLPSVDQEQAALAMFHIGNMLMAQKKAEDAMGAYVESLRLNAGQRMLLGTAARDDSSHQYGRDFCTTLSDKVAQFRPVSGDDCQLARLEKQADDTRNNLLALLSANPELAKKLAEPGKLGPPAQVPGQPGNGEQKDQIPGPDAGQGNPDAI
jgi:hypothetical protein